jgi:D-proline reductase (dithiol) PrdB
MSAFLRLKNQLIAKVITRFPALSKKFVDSYVPTESTDIPWSDVKKTLSECTVSLVTTAGVHHKNDRPFNMSDSDGDPSYRVIDLKQPLSELTITHDYYDHTDADKDINIVFPIERLMEFEKEGIIKKLARKHYGFMGHIVNQHIETLIHVTAPEIAQKLRADSVDVVLLTPG